ncbi:MAG: TolC family protein [Pseudomonadota bacterium]
MKKILAIGSLVFLTTVASAEELTWDVCVAEASRGNADLSVARSNLDAARFQKRAAFSPFLPQVAGELAISRGNTGANGVTQNDYSIGATGRQNLFSGFQDRAKFDQAAGNEELLGASYDLARAKASSDLKSAFAGLRYAQDSIVLTDQIAKRREGNLSLVELRFEGGRENKGSYFLSKAALHQSRFESLQAKNAVEVTRQQLARILGRNEADELAASGTVPLTEPGEPPVFGRLVPLTPAHRQVEAQEKISQAALALARSQFYPSLDASGSYGKGGSEWFPDTTRWSLGLTLSVPLFSGGKDYYTAKAASASLAAAFSNRENIDRQVLTSLKQAYTAYVEAAEKVKVDQEFLDASTVRAEIARHKYNNGLLSFEDWDIIENDLIARQKAFLQTRRDRVSAEAAWEQAQGKGVIR